MAVEDYTFAQSIHVSRTRCEFLSRAEVVRPTCADTKIVNLGASTVLVHD
jgi:hypothetical protein